MPVMDEFKEEREALKHGTPKQKLQYFWDYYKWHVIIGIAVIVLLYSFIHQYVTRKDVAFEAILLNSSTKEMSLTMEDTQTVTDFAAYAGVDTDKYDVVMDTSISIGLSGSDDVNSSQKLLVIIAAAEVDTMVSDSSSIEKYAYQSNFKDLTEFLTAEQLEKYKDRFYYMDRAVAEELTAQNRAGNYEYVPDYPDSTKPELMTDPVIVGLRLPADSPLFQDYIFLSDDVIACVLVNAPHEEITSQFLEYMMQ